MYHVCSIRLIGENLLTKHVLSWRLHLFFLKMRKQNFDGPSWYEEFPPGNNCGTLVVKAFIGWLDQPILPMQIHTLLPVVNQIVTLPLQMLSYKITGRTYLYRCCISTIASDQNVRLNLPCLEASLNRFARVVVANFDKEMPWSRAPDFPNYLPAFFLQDIYLEVIG